MGMHVLGLKIRLKKLSERWGTSFSVGEELNGKNIIRNKKNKSNIRLLYSRQPVAEMANDKFLVIAFIKTPLFRKGRILRVFTGRNNFACQL